MELSEDDVLHILKLIDESKFDYFQLEVGELKITVSKGEPIPLNSAPQQVATATTAPAPPVSAKPTATSMLIKRMMPPWDFGGARRGVSTFVPSKVAVFQALSGAPRTGPEKITRQHVGTRTPYHTAASVQKMRMEGPNSSRAR